MLGVSCGDTTELDDAAAASTEATEPPQVSSTPASTATGEASAATESESSAQSRDYLIDVWADNWFALYINGEKLGEDSVPITVERSFNKESFQIATPEITSIAIEAKDYKETDSGLEYIGQPNQQIGDGGLIVQITDASGTVVASSDDSWRSFVVQSAPLNPECVTSSDPDTACSSLELDAPEGWYDSEFDDSSWENVSVYSEADVRPKDGYSEVIWDPSAQFIWSSDLELDNTVLLRKKVSK